MESFFPTPSNQTQLARDRVVADLYQLVDDSEVFLRATAGDVSEQTREARAKLTAVVERVKTTVGDWQQKGIDSARYVAQRGDDLVRRRPYEALATALIVGVLVALVAGRKKFVPEEEPPRTRRGRTRPARA